MCAMLYSDEASVAWQQAQSLEMKRPGVCHHVQG